MKDILRILFRTWVAMRDPMILLVGRVWARFWGVTAHPSVRFYGLPKIQVARESRVVLHQGVVVRSSISTNSLIGRRTTTLGTVAAGALLEIEANVGVSGACICAAKEIRIGKGTIIGADAMILDNDFHLPGPDWGWADAVSETASPIRIGRGCFIGTRAIILKGVTLGDGAVVGAGAVVTSDVPPAHLAFGNPARTRPLPAKWQRGP